MSRRSRHVPPKSGNAAEDLMQWYLKDRASADTWIDTDVARSCTSKQQYADEMDARAHALMNGMGDVLFSYECRYCGFWHLTRRPT
ncbi:hypothetical protein WPS_32810 [Vulcanimicrobium alpinum]|uniref:Uncharacterized protein n=1 Tax=Vulcanimicrobium alpinum TaxID=3016050 RepID=A0AAN1XZV6_UNVUL|nr:hypothetical protein [Vulcanimicrobium alpinum]BDE08005.1 hypothetical protein WPS_32810 [Vulcanimicrobium alpinum]